MATLHTFGCSITQGFALPDTIKPAVNEQGQLLTGEEIEQRGIHWSEIHLYQPSEYAWPKVLGDRLGMTTVNYARRGACFQQIARQCAQARSTIQPEDTVIVMWTYFSRLSLQWPARTCVPFGSLADPNWGWKTVMVGFNKLFGLSHSKNTTTEEDQKIREYIERSTKQTYLDPMGTYNRYYNNLVLQTMTAGFLENTGARVIHLSVEMEPVLRQLEESRRELPKSLREPYTIPDPQDWYDLTVDYDSCYALLDPMIPPAENDTHPSITHHRNFADVINRRYFQGRDS